MIANFLVMIKGAGDLASGVALRLHHSGFPVVMTELPHPLAIRRTASFSDAIYNGCSSVENTVARLINAPDDVMAVIQKGEIPIAVDPEGQYRRVLPLRVFIDATVSKHNNGVTLTHAPLVIALGPGFVAGQDVHAVIETRRGHTLGRVIWTGIAAVDTGIPGLIGGVSADRVIHAPQSGKLRHVHHIGDILSPGELIAWIDNTPITAAIGGVLRGLIHENTPITTGLKIADIDPRANVEHCYTVSDKALAVAGGVLEAILASMINRADV